MLSFFNICWLIMAQVPAGASAAAQPPPGDEGGGTGLFGDFWTFMIAMLAVILVWTLFLPKPQQNQPVKTSELLSKLKKNDRVVTAGGILGTVVNFGKEDEYVTLRIDDDRNTRIQILATSIVRIVSDKDNKEVK